MFIIVMSYQGTKIFILSLILASTFKDSGFLNQGNLVWSLFFFTTIIVVAILWNEYLLFVSLDNIKRGFRFFSLRIRTAH